MGLTKDKFDRIIDYLRISVTDRCNLRCVYCMPGEGVRLIHFQDILSYEEIVRVVRIASRLGVRKVRLTGGEPLVRKDLPHLIEAIAGIEGIEDISLTTNGLLLSRLAGTLAAAGLKRVNISLDSLDPERYREITRGGNINDVREGIRAAENAGLHPIKINMVAIRGVNDDEIVRFARWTAFALYDVRFIELMPFGRGNHWSREEILSAEEMKGGISAVAPLIPVKARSSGPARYYRFPGALGTIGFISPVSHHFCNSCNRLRLTADGKLRPCLFSDEEIDLKLAMRQGASDTIVEELLRLSVNIKPERHTLTNANNLKPMSMIGG